MGNNSRREKLVGVVMSLPTFCDDEYNLLLDRQRKHVRWVIDQGIKEGDGVVIICGGVGETYFLEDEEFNALTDLLADEARGEVPTAVMVHEISARRAARKARHAADAGIDFVILCPPHYTLPSEDDIYLHHKYVNDAADIGIVAYNTYWAMPRPGYEFSARLFERFATLENMVGIKWSATDVNHYLGMQRLFGDRFNFIENHRVFSLGSRLGMKGFIDWYANVAPRFSLHLWELLKTRRYDEYDEVWKKYRFDPSIQRGAPDEKPPLSVAESAGITTMLRLMGLDTGPLFPTQATLPETFVQYSRRVFEASGIMEWVDWDQSILD